MEYERKVLYFYDLSLSKDLNMVKSKMKIFGFYNY